MAKKKAEQKDTTPVIVTEVKAELLPARVEAPELLVPVVKEYGLELSDNKVDSHLRTFLPYVAQLVDLEKELNDLLTGTVTPELSKQASDLRKKYRDIRTSSDETKAAEKRDFVIEGRFLDKVNNTISDAAKTKEAKCLEIEKHLENIENARIEKLKQDRKDILEALNYDTEFLNLAEMTEESFARMVKKAEEAKLGADALAKQKEKEQEEQVERDRLAQEHTNRLRLRTARANSVGLVYDEATRNYTGIFGRIDTDVLEFFNDLDFEKYIAPVEVKFASDKKAKDDLAEKEREAKERIKNRINALSGLGLIFNPATTNYEGFGQSIAIGDVEGLDAVSFTDNFDLIKTAVTKAKSEQKKKDDAAAKETLRLQNEEKARLAQKEQEKEAARTAELAPDKEKFKAFYQDLLKMKAPNFTTAEGVAVGLSIGSHLTTLIKAVKGEANRLV